MAEPTDYTHRLNLTRSLLIVTALQGHQDLKAIRLIRAFRKPVAWEPLGDLIIDKEVWKYAAGSKKYDPKLVFCHPDVLLEEPQTCLYYRALCGLSLKAARSYFGSVEALEKGSPGGKLSKDKALKMARIFNAFICTIIKGSTDWTLENGRRTIIATLGITLDGKMRNKIGEIAEQRVRKLIVGWLCDRHLVVNPDLERTTLENIDRLPYHYLLQGGIKMRFGSDPDVEFTRNEELLAVVEIKGGIDPAGALERYGAAQKSFQHAI